MTIIVFFNCNFVSPQAIVDRLPSPLQSEPDSYDRNKNLKALLFDSHFEMHRGVVTNLLIKEGKLSKGDKITTHWLQQHGDKGRKPYEVKEVGILRPERCAMETLYAGMMRFRLSCNCDTK